MHSDYLRLAEVFDPRVTTGYLPENIAYVKDLLKKSKKFAKNLLTRDGDQSSSDDGKEDYDRQCDIFRKHIVFLESVQM